MKRAIKFTALVEWISQQLADLNSVAIHTSSDGFCWLNPSDADYWTKNFAPNSDDYKPYVLACIYMPSYVSHWAQDWAQEVTGDEIAKTFAYENVTEEWYEFFELMCDDNLIQIATWACLIRTLILKTKTNHKRNVLQRTFSTRYQVAIIANYLGMNDATFCKIAEATLTNYISQRLSCIMRIQERISGTIEKLKFYPTYYIKMLIMPNLPQT